MATPYRDGLEAARRRLRQEQERLEVRAASLGADQRESTARLLDALRAEFGVPCHDMRDVARREHTLRAFEAVLDDVVPAQAYRRARLVLVALAAAMILPVMFGSARIVERYRYWRTACPQSQACQDDGACAPRLGGLNASVSSAACTPSSDDACAQSAACTVDGRCTLRGQRCVATSDEACAAAAYCHQYDGACIAQQGRCVPTAP